MVEGESGSVSATVVPGTSLIRWSSDNESVAIVDGGGEIRAVGIGNASITATITVGGEDYSDQASVNVEEAFPEWEVVRDFTGDSVWGNPDYFVSQEYTDNLRMTYCEDGANEIDFVYDPNGEQSTLFLDVRPAVDGFVYDDAFDYALKVRYDSDVIHATLRATRANANALIGGDWNGYDMHGMDGWEILPLGHSEGDKSRLFVLQAKVLGEYADVERAKFRFKLVRKAKE